MMIHRYRAMFMVPEAGLPVCPGHIRAVMPGGSAATAAAERLLDGLRGADQYRKAALEYAHAPFTKAKRGEAKSHSGDEDSIIPSLQELWHLIWKAHPDTRLTECQGGKEGM